MIDQVNEDDIALYADDERTQVFETLHTLRQQGKKAANLPYLALANFVAPKGKGDDLHWRFCPHHRYWN